MCSHLRGTSRCPIPTRPSIGLPPAHYVQKIPSAAPCPLSLPQKAVRLLHREPKSCQHRPSLLLHGIDTSRRGPCESVVMSVPTPRDLPSRPAFASSPPKKLCCDTDGVPVPTSFLPRHRNMKVRNRSSSPHAHRRPPLVAKPPLAAFCTPQFRPSPGLTIQSHLSKAALVMSRSTFPTPAFRSKLHLPLKPLLHPRPHPKIHVGP